MSDFLKLVRSFVGVVVFSITAISGATADTLAPIYNLILADQEVSEPPISGPTVVAKSCSVADVQAAIDLSVDGETVLIPPGQCAWDSAVSMNSEKKSIRLLGSGEAQTRIIANVAPVLTISGNASRRWELAHFTIVSNSGGQHIVTIGGEANNWRVHHLSFQDVGDPTFVFGVFGKTYGLIDHLTVSGQNSGIVTIVGGGGDVWVDPEFNQWGDEKAVFLEDSVINITGFNEGRGTFDCQHGGRYVLRNNTIKNQRTVNHGLDTGGFYSCLSSEIYNNRVEFDFPTSDGAVFWRGGSTLIHNNLFVYDPDLFASAHIRLGNFRANSDINNLSWPACNGTQYKINNSSWSQFLEVGTDAAYQLCSGNRMRICIGESDCTQNNEGSCSEFVDGTNGSGAYPCFQQVGRGLNNSLNPVYIWGNTFTGAVGQGGFSCPAGQVCVADSVSQGNFIERERDYFVGTARPGYTPFTYPHPLQQE